LHEDGKFRRERWRQPYEVIARDSESVVIRTRDEIAAEDCLMQIRFEGDR